MDDDAASFERPLEGPGADRRLAELRQRFRQAGEAPRPGAWGRVAYWLAPGVIGAAIALAGLTLGSGDDRAG